VVTQLQPIVSISMIRIVPCVIFRLNMSIQSISFSFWKLRIGPRSSRYRGIPNERACSPVLKAMGASCSNVAILSCAFSLIPFL